MSSLCVGFKTAYFEEDKSLPRDAMQGLVAIKHEAAQIPAGAL